MRTTWVVVMVMAATAGGAGCGKVTGVAGDAAAIDAASGGDDGGGGADAGACTTPPCLGAAASFPSTPARNLDLLFVIDDSGTMAEEQASLLTNTSRLVNVLENFPGGLPDVHIGVVSTNLGAGPFDLQGCAGDGDGGRLLIGGGTECGVAGHFVTDIANSDGSRTVNYTGTLADAVSCMTNLGIAGCGFEQPLEAMRRALNGSNPDNAGFLRADAYLAVIILSDEDDCSASDDNLFEPTTSIDDPRGPLSSFRCFEFGVRCDPDDPRALGAKASCVPRTDSPYLYAPGVYVEFLRALKSDPRKVMVAGILGNPMPVEVGTDGGGNPELLASCTSAAGTAAPAIRTKAFLDGFPQHSAFATICNEDLSDALVAISQQISTSFVGLCLSGPLHDTGAAPGVQPECVVTESRPGAASVELPVCDAPAQPDQSTNTPCYVTRPDALCADSGVAISIHRGGIDPPADGWIDVACLLD